MRIVSWLWGRVTSVVVVTCCPPLPQPLPVVSFLSCCSSLIGFSTVYMLVYVLHDCSRKIIAQSVVWGAYLMYVQGYHRLEPDVSRKFLPLMRVYSLHSEEETCIYQENTSTKSDPLVGGNFQPVGYPACRRSVCLSFLCTLHVQY